VGDRAGSPGGINRNRVKDCAEKWKEKGSGSCRRRPHTSRNRVYKYGGVVAETEAPIFGDWGDDLVNSAIKNPANREPPNWLVIYLLVFGLAGLALIAIAPSLTQYEVVSFGKYDSGPVKSARLEPWVRWPVAILAAMVCLVGACHFYGRYRIISLGFLHIITLTTALAIRPSVGDLLLGIIIKVTGKYRGPEGYAYNNVTVTLGGQTIALTIGAIIAFLSSYFGLCLLYRRWWARLLALVPICFLMLITWLFP
jgi:hypothetical protein